MTAGAAALMAVAEASQSLLQQLPNGGAVVAVIAITVLYLKRAERSEDVLRGVVEAFAADAAAGRAEYRQHVTDIMAAGLAAHAETRAAIRSLDATLAGLKDAGDRPAPHEAPAYRPGDEKR